MPRHIFMDPDRLRLQVSPVGLQEIADLRIYKWSSGYACPPFIDHNYDVDMDEEYKIAYGPERIWTTGVATCVAIVIRCYDNIGKYIASYVRHDSIFADATVYEKCEALHKYLEEALTHVPTSVKLCLYLVGGCKRPVGNYWLLRMDEEKDVRKSLDNFGTVKRIACELKAYLLFFNLSSRVDGEDCSSVSVIAGPDDVEVIMNDDFPGVPDGTL